MRASPMMMRVMTCSIRTSKAVNITWKRMILLLNALVYENSSLIMNIIAMKKQFT